MNLYDPGIRFILWLQSLGNWLAYPMQFFSFLGYEQFYLLIAPALYWCVNAELGLRFGLFLMVSANINGLAKLAFHGPRPYWVDQRVRALGIESSFGIPSGHAQNAVVVWSTLAGDLRRRWAWILVGLLIFFIGFSRLVLGVHFPHDVLAGWLIGAILIYVLIQLEPRVKAWISQSSLSIQILVTLIVSLAFILAGLMINSSWGSWTLPVEWVNNSHLARPEADPLDPTSFSEIVSNAGVFLGLAFGALLIRRKGGFSTIGLAWVKVARYFLGVAGVVVLWMGLGAVFPGGQDVLAFTLRFIRYALIGTWITYLAPLLFIRLKLATTA
jgi:membrane-associated phospholipid phosphatase